MSWPVVKLSDVAMVNPRLPKDADEHQQVSFVAMASASEQGFLLAEESRVLKETKKGFTYFDAGDVLLAKITPCFENGKCLRPNQITNKIGFGSTEFHVLRAIPEKLDSTYLFYLVWCDRFRNLGEASMSGAAGQKRVSTDFLRDFEIPLPPLEEQKRIAAILDKADAIRRKRQQAIKLVEDFLRSVFLEMFGDLFCDSGYRSAVRKSIAELTDYIDYRGKTPEKSECGVPLITAKNVRMGYVSEEPKEFIPEESYEGWMTRGLPFENDVLFTTEAPLGNVALLGRYERVALGQRLISLRSKGKVTQEYLLFALLNPFVQGLIDSKSSGSTAKGIRTKELYQIEIPVPDIAMQLKFSSVYRKSVVNKQRHSCAYESACSLFESLSQKAFSGQL